jgi:hypothetical protein
MPSNKKKKRAADKQEKADSKAKAAVAKLQEDENRKVLSGMGNEERIAIQETTLIDLLPQPCTVEEFVKFFPQVFAALDEKRLKITMNAFSSGPLLLVQDLMDRGFIDFCTRTSRETLCVGELVKINSRTHQIGVIRSVCETDKIMGGRGALVAEKMDWFGESFICEYLFEKRKRKHFRPV